MEAERQLRFTHKKLYIFFIILLFSFEKDYDCNNLKIEKDHYEIISTAINFLNNNEKEILIKNSNVKYLNTFSEPGELETALEFLIKINLKLKEELYPIIKRYWNCKILFEDRFSLNFKYKIIDEKFKFDNISLNGMLPNPIYYFTLPIINENRKKAFLIIGWMDAPLSCVDTYVYLEKEKSKWIVKKIKKFILC